MRRTLGVATFLGLGASAVAVGATTIAADGKVHLRGSDTLKDITTQVLAACSLGTGSIVYDGGGSSNGQSELNNNNQQIAPMSRAINSSGCSGIGAAKGEGIVIGLDGLSIVAATPVVSQCSNNPVAGEDCNATTDPTTGLAYTKAFDTTVACTVDADCASLNGGAGVTCNTTTSRCRYTLGAGLTGTADDWKDALRLIYGGMDANDGSTIANRDCDGAIRVALVNNWGNIFEGTCTAGGCTQLHHAFRRDDESGTTDTFVSALGLPSINLTNNVSPFCNALAADQDNVSTQACVKDADCFDFDCNETTGLCRLPRRPYFTDMQDFDRIRRPCVGTGNLPGPPTGTLGNPPPSEPTEQVCNRDGTLGLVVPIQPPPVGTSNENYPVKYCRRGVFSLGAASTVEVLPPPTGTVRDRCPNGDVTFFNGCYIPEATDGDTACVNGRNNLPGFKLDLANAIAVDGRVYNRILRKGGTGPDKGTLPTVVRNTQQVDVVNAFYRIHTTRSMAAAPSFKNVCRGEADATSQLGCLVVSSQCSLSFAGNSAASVAAPNTNLVGSTCNTSADCGVGGTCEAKCTTTGAACTVDADCGTGAGINCGICTYAPENPGALEVAALEPSDLCVRKLLPGSIGTPYPIARKLFVNTLDGFEALSAQSLASPHSELGLAQCFSTDSIVHPIVRTVGFITLGDVTAQPGTCSNAASLFCEPTCSSDCTNHAASGVTTRTTPVDLSAGWVPDDTNSCP